MSSSQSKARVGKHADGTDFVPAESDDALQGSQDGSEHADGSVAETPESGNTSASASTTASSDATHVNGVDALSTILSTPSSELDLNISALKYQRDNMKREKKRRVVKLRGQARKRTRRQARARLLGTDDLLEVYAMRVRAKQARNSSAAE